MKPGSLKFLVPVVSAFLLFSISASAQLGKSLGNSTAGKAGQLLTQFANALKPSSFTDAFKSEKGNWLSKAQKVSDAVGVANSISSLAGFIKPGLFKEGSSVQSILNTANTVKSMTDAAGLLKSLEGGLKPEAFLQGWSKQRVGWTSALNLLK
jgi:hypothetical protein